MKNTVETTCKSAGMYQYSKTILAYFCVSMLFFFAATNSVYADRKVPDCFKAHGLKDPGDKVNALYILIDQTTYLTQAMKETLSNWFLTGVNTVTELNCYASRPI